MVIATTHKWTCYESVLNGCFLIVSMVYSDVISVKVLFCINYSQRGITVATIDNTNYQLQFLITVLPSIVPGTVV